MILEKNKNITIELERLKKLRTLVAFNKKLAEHNDEPDDMTINDLEEWLKEIDKELKTIKNKEPYIS
jgi:hypothetical protein